MKSSIEELEKICATDGEDTKILREIAAELRQRKSKRAASLLENLEQRLMSIPFILPASSKRLSKSGHRASQSNQSSKDNQKEELRPETNSAPALAKAPDAESQEEHPPLPSHLAEFVVALKEEVEAAKRNLGSSAALLSEGRLIAPVGGGFHYRFLSQRPLRVPPDTPGFLVVDRSEDDLPVSVVEVEDLAVVLELPKNIGSSVSQAKLKTDLTMLLLRLIERIESKGLDDHPAAERILGLMEPSVGVQTIESINPRLNTEQRLAVERVLGGDTVFIWGPPGTGKTQTIGEIGAQLFLRQKTLLIASHTNTAVDEALLRIAEALKGKIREGEVLRLGEPVKTELQARPDLILKRVAEKRSIELEQQKMEAVQSKAFTLEQLEQVHRRVEIYQWLNEAENDCESFERRHLSLQNADRELAVLAGDLAQHVSDEAKWKKLRIEADEAIQDHEKRLRVETSLIMWSRKFESAEHALEGNEGEKRRTEDLLDLAQQADPARKRVKSLPGLKKAHLDVELARRRSNHLRNLHQADVVQLESAVALLQQTLSVGAIKRMWLKLPKPEEQQKEIALQKTKAEHSLATLEAAEKESARSEMIQSELNELVAFLQPFNEIPQLADAEAGLRHLKESALQLSEEKDKCKELCGQLARERDELTEKISRFVEETGVSPESAKTNAQRQLLSIETLGQRVVVLKKANSSERRRLVSDLSELIAALTAWGLCEGGADKETDLLGALRVAQQNARDEVGGNDFQSLEVERNRLSARVAQLIEEIRSIEESLKRVEADLLANVQILATTLTRSFMREGIQQRYFDTVLVDEASMAPIPALWAASTLSRRCIVAVGDFKQLPPIVQSEHSVAKRWLGRDIFAASGVQGAWERGAHPPHFVALKEQHRMHPEISAIVNALIYDGLLRDGVSVVGSKADSSIASWHAGLFEASHRVNIIDMGPAKAWNTTADRSRFNLLSAMTSIEIVHHWLASYRSKLNEGQAKRILVICPYRPQAKLLDVLVREDKLEIEVAANTAHSFQGSEADAVLIDLVVDEPHFNANLLTRAADADIARLLNVAITRAKRKVCIMGDLGWFRAKGRTSFVGGTLLPWLCERNPVRDVMDTFAEIEGINDRKSVISASETHVALSQSMVEASRQVVIFSPNLDLSTVLKFVEQAPVRGLSAFVVTQTPGEQRGGMDQHSKAESLLRDAGFCVIHKPKMVEKILLIDAAEVWTTTFSLLGAAPDKGYAVRRKSKKFAAEVNDFYFVEQLTAPYLDGEHRCPICDKEMVAGDSRSDKPFYWYCVESGCYSRDLDTAAPVDGLITFRCGSAPEFGYWGERAFWLCSCGQKPAHRTRIHKNHLKFPKMRALVPQRSWCKLCRDLGVDPNAGAQATLPLD